MLTALQLRPLRLAFLTIALTACTRLPSAPASQLGDTESVAAITTAAAVESPGTTPRAAAPPTLTPLTLMLDYQPNTHHSGLYLAQERGYFRAAGLDLRIIEPGEVYPEQALIGGAADFGISFQESLTLARAQGAPLVSLAAIVQHNQSAFASPKALGLKGALDYAGKRYGGFGSPFEAPTLKALMACAAQEAGVPPPPAVTEINLGLSDPLVLLGSGAIDLAWIFEGWQGVQARRQGLELDLVRLADHRDCIPDYYTPILIGREADIAGRPDAVRAFVGAAARGYAAAIADPPAAAAALLAAAPALDADLVQESQAWLSPRYQDDAPRWGEQRAEVWQAYADWLQRQGVLEAPLDLGGAFDNRFLP